MQNFSILLKNLHIFHIVTKKNQIPNNDAFTLFNCWRKRLWLTCFQCVKVFCPKIGSCKFFDKYQVCSHDSLLIVWTKPGNKSSSAVEPVASTGDARDPGVSSNLL